MSITYTVTRNSRNKFEVFSINEHGEHQATGFSFSWEHQAIAQKSELEWANNPTIQTILHPKTKLLKREIKRVDNDHSMNGQFYFEDDRDCYENLAECIVDAKKNMDYSYSGEYSKDCMNHYAEVAAERGC
jgi:hypothetical protein